jgi:hypothetical protein
MRRAATTCALAGLLVVTAACADYVGDDLRDGATGRGDVVILNDLDRTDVPAPDPVPTDPIDLEPGMCFDDPDDTTLVAFSRGRTVNQLPCRVPHRYELYARAPLATDPEEPWPGSAPAEERADVRCADEFEAFVGTAWVDSTLDYVFLTPSEARWRAGDSQVSCVLFDLGLVLLTGSMAGSER